MIEKRMTQFRQMIRKHKAKAVKSGISAFYKEFIDELCAERFIIRLNVAWSILRRKKR